MVRRYNRVRVPMGQAMRIGRCGRKVTKTNEKNRAGLPAEQSKKNQIVNKSKRAKKKSLILTCFPSFTEFHRIFAWPPEMRHFLSRF